jgi:hypothetical protein
MILILINSKDRNDAFNMLDAMGMSVAHSLGGIEVSQANLNSALNVLEQACIVHQIND